MQDNPYSRAVIGAGSSTALALVWGVYFSNCRQGAD